VLATRSDELQDDLELQVRNTIFKDANLRCTDGSHAASRGLIIAARFSKWYPGIIPLGAMSPKQATKNLKASACNRELLTVVVAVQPVSGCS
jgi:hypothetical protein